MHGSITASARVVPSRNRSLRGRPPLENVVAAILKPAGRTKEEVASAEQELVQRRDSGNLGKIRLCLAIRAMGAEPCDAKKGRLGTIVPDHLPDRTFAEAWEMVLKNIRLIGKFLSRIQNLLKKCNIPEKDAEQILTENMFWAALFHDGSRAAFSTYAMEWFKRGRTGIVAEAGLITFPHHIVTEMIMLERFRDRHPLMPAHRIADCLDMAPVRVERLMRLRGLRESSIRPLNADTLFNSDTPTFRMHETPDETRGVVPITSFPHDVVEKMRPHQEDAILREQLDQSMRNALLVLTPRESRVLKMRFGFGTGEGDTFEEAARKMNVTRERIRQIEAKALRKLWHPSRRSLHHFLEDDD
ncbi:MAG: sigma-70 family RNA polymerase sigma factor [Candidatus Micrarchaeota archaeon]